MVVKTKTATGKMKIFFLGWLEWQRLRRSPLFASSASANRRDNGLPNFCACSWKTPVGNTGATPASDMHKVLFLTALRSAESARKKWNLM